MEDIIYTIHWSLSYVFFLASSSFRARPRRLFSIQNMTQNLKNPRLLTNIYQLCLKKNFVCTIKLILGLCLANLEPFLAILCPLYKCPGRIVLVLN